MDFIRFTKTCERKIIMTKKILALLFALTMLFSLAACAADKKEEEKSTDAQASYLPAQNSEVGIPEDGAWKNAKYREDKTFGNGAKTITLYVVAEEVYVTFTIKTDKETLAEALIENKIVEGDENGPYGLYINKVNGIAANYEKDKTYWSFELEGQAQVHGVSEEMIEDGEHFELVLRQH